MLFSIHGILAAATQVPELALDKKESVGLAQGIANVARHYDLGATQKTVDWGNLIVIVGTVYGSRMFAIRARRSRERATEQASEAAAEASQPYPVPPLTMPPMQ